MNKLAICTVVYENYDVLEDFLRSLKHQTNQNFQLFVADVSTNKKPIDDLSNKLTVIDTYNQGYAHGINVCLLEAIQQGFTSFCVINDDTYFKEHFVDNVLKSLKSHPASIIGGKIYYAPGFEFHKDRYEKSDQGNVVWYAGGKIDWNHVTTTHIGVDEVDAGQFDKLEETDFVTGCLTCFDKAVIDKVGLWDASYFLYYEDTDFCERAKRAGMKLYYDPSIVLWHKNAQSTDGSGSKLHQHYQTKNRLKFGLKYAPLRTKFHLLKNVLFRKII